MCTLNVSASPLHVHCFLVASDQNLLGPNPDRWSQGEGLRQLQRPSDRCSLVSRLPQRRPPTYGRPRQAGCGQVLAGRSCRSGCWCLGNPCGRSRQRFDRVEGFVWEHEVRASGVCANETLGGSSLVCAESSQSPVLPTICHGGDDGAPLGNPLRESYHGWVCT